MLIHPFDITAEIDQFKNKNREDIILTKIDIKTIEAEISLKQLFHIRIMGEKIIEEFGPLI